MDPEFYNSISGGMKKVVGANLQAPIPQTSTNHSSAQNTGSGPPHRAGTDWTVDSPIVWRGDLNNEQADVDDPRTHVGWTASPTGKGKSLPQSSAMVQQHSPLGSAMDQDDGP
jgi:hypothetical protein